MKKAKAITVARAQLGKPLKGFEGPKRRETMTHMTQSFNNRCDKVQIGDKKLKASSPRELSMTVNVLRKSWNRGLVPR